MLFTNYKNLRVYQRLQKSTSNPESVVFSALTVLISLCCLLAVLYSLQWQTVKIESKEYIKLPSKNYSGNVRLYGYKIVIANNELTVGSFFFSKDNIVEIKIIPFLNYVYGIRSQPSENGPYHYGYIYDRADKLLIISVILFFIGSVSQCVNYYIDENNNTTWGFLLFSQIALVIFLFHFVTFIIFFACFYCEFKATIYDKKSELNST